ncbi:hypothetical protein EVAR_81868_1 [Eumeta japonica]|uniref:Uncharacterized protein n=1 Tax=Eumeta variegata TaxID=151549 RepID=A0A4C1UXJ8_EUMVA|nr:hypothetical protein EVAR_81868_1 [Eumeta japonica]
MTGVGVPRKTWGNVIVANRSTIGGGCSDVDLDARRLRNPLHYYRVVTASSESLIRGRALTRRHLKFGRTAVLPISTVNYSYVRRIGCGWESLMKSVTLGNVTMSHRTRERPAECLASLSHSTMIGLRAQH